MKEFPGNVMILASAGSGKTFALTGTVDQRRLNDIATALQTSLGGSGKSD